MRLFDCGRVLGLVAGLLAPACAHAAPTLTLDFTGTASAGSFAGIFAYTQPSPPAVDLSGRPVTLQIVISDYLTRPFVSGFDIHWMGPVPPFGYVMDGGGFASSYEAMDTAYQSVVSLTDAGGAIRAFPSLALAGRTDGGTDLTFSYSLSAPQDLRTSFFDAGVDGGGAADVRVNRDVSAFGLSDKTTSGTFTVSSLRATVSGVPEPATWALMIGGFGGVGAAMRWRRRMAA
jgi:hypothetical protein